MEFKLFDKERDIKLLKRVGIASLIIASWVFVAYTVRLIDNNKNSIAFGNESDDCSYYEEFPEYDGTCNVAKIDLHGFVDVDYYYKDETSSSEIVQEIERTSRSEYIKAIILDVDSSGGVVVAGKEISNALSHTGKPTIALIRNVGLSVAYWSAVGADVIFASLNSGVGDIGITDLYIDDTKQNQYIGRDNQFLLAVGKDILNPEKFLTDEEKKIMERDMTIMHNNFVETVAEKRNLEIEKVRALADGSVMLGQMALENGLIDKIGDLYAVRQYLAEIIGEEVVICQ